MGSNNSNMTNVQQNFMNNILQDNQENCISTVNNSTNNNVVILNGSKVDGNFTGASLTVSTDATCLITSSMNNTVTDILSATATQTTTTENDMFGDFSYNSDYNTFNVEQSVVNNIAQINQMLCSASAVTSQNDNFFYITNTVVEGNFIGVTTQANASASCNMSNVMVNSTYNQTQSTSNQTGTIKGMFVAIAGSIAGIIMMVVVVIIIGGIGYLGYETYSKTKAGTVATTSMPQFPGFPPSVQGPMQYPGANYPGTQSQYPGANYPQIEPPQYPGPNNPEQQYSPASNFANKAYDMYGSLRNQAGNFNPEFEEEE